IFLGTQGYLDKIPVEKVAQVEADFHTFMESRHSQLGKTLAEKKELTDDLTAKLKAAIEEFLKTIKDKKDKEKKDAPAESAATAG
ncbi:MAG: hypothetical protein QF593_14370, partial [Nitrospinota bacterium]|nr:hypothetical protein [Nitrospinota bacterium]